MELRAAVFYGVGEIRIEDIPTPKIGSREMLVRVRACAVCRTDVRIFLGEKKRGVRIPSILGHELSGEIVEVGSEVKGFREGDRVAVAPVIPCGRCYLCLSGQENACLNRTAIGYEYDGGFAEFIKIPEQAVGNVFRIPDELSFHEATLAEPLSCCINALRKVNLKLGDSVLIIGAGFMGLMFTKLCRLAGCSIVIVSEPLDERRRLAEGFGADATLNRIDEPSKVRELTDGLGVNAVIATAPEEVNLLLSLLRKGGALNLFTGLPEEGGSEVDLNLIHYNELLVTGTSASTRLDFLKALSLIASKELEVKKLISDVRPLERLLSAFDDVRERKALKIIIEP